MSHASSHLDATSDGLLRSLRGSQPALAKIARNAELAGRFPTEAVTQLREWGALGAPLPRAYGGLGWGFDGNETLFEVLRLLGTASLGLGRIYEAHVNALRLAVHYGHDDTRSNAANDAKAGHLFALWVTSAKSEGVHLTKISDRLRIAGTKSFCSAAGYATRAVITISDVDGEIYLVMIDATKPVPAATEIVQMHGMRSAVTCPTSFDFEVGPNTKFGSPEDYMREPEFSAGAWRTLAVTAGGLHALVTETIRQLRARERHTAPLQAARIGEMLIDTTTATTWARMAAGAAANEALEAGEITGTVNLARTAIERCCLNVISLVERSLGLASLLPTNQVESMIRDLATYLRQPAVDEALIEAATWFAENPSDLENAASRRR